MVPYGSVGVGACGSLRSCTRHPRNSAPPYMRLHTVRSVHPYPKGSRNRSRSPGHSLRTHPCSGSASNESRRMRGRHSGDFRTYGHTPRSFGGRGRDRLRTRCSVHRRSPDNPPRSLRSHIPPAGCSSRGHGSRRKDCTTPLRSRSSDCRCLHTFRCKLWSLPGRRRSRALPVRSRPSKPWGRGTTSRVRHR